jgi:hypothetical protein
MIGMVVVSLVRGCCFGGCGVGRRQSFTVLRGGGGVEVVVERALIRGQLTPA